MKVAWIALSVFAGSLVCLGIGCGDEGTGGSSSSGGASSSSSGESSTSGGASSSSGTTSGGSSSSGSTSGGSSSGSGVYQVCSDCTSNTTGAYTKECKTQVDACNADAKCAALLTYSYDTCGYDGCCPLKQAMTDMVPAASLALYKAVENCATCGACKDLCKDVDPTMNSITFCEKLNAANPMCP